MPPTCSHCNKEGHEASSCWSLHPCVHCDKPGLSSDFCYEFIMYPDSSSRESAGHGSGRGRGSAEANNAIASCSSTPSSTSSLALHLFSAEQWKALTGVIGTAKISYDRLNGMFSPIEWIIDIGATQHVTSEKLWLIDVEQVHDCPLGLPNGSSVTATHKGSVRLSTHLILINVLFVLEFSCN